MGIKIGDNNKIKNATFIDNKSEKSDDSHNIWDYIIIPIIVTVIGGLITAYVQGWLGM
ncbi:hypothetical protein [Petrocella sp. FN5]|uniref:hypothetical protein n=1 Tax=Petrocella sp. FN5 TaxID=3032002 RepID=UPI0023DBD7B0|nr:hypothetical protein [Petrocella sp. FN5]MDF1617981.1 hypothetical protein [Petrocella sp. FN5]